MSWHRLADARFEAAQSASDFAREFRRLLAELDEALTPLEIATASALTADKQQQHEALRAELNEYQTRWYFVDGMLALLGWLSPIDRARMFGSHPHLTVEQRLSRLNTGRYHWLDYAGFEVAPDGRSQPLLAVEAKRSEGDNAWSLPQWFGKRGQRSLSTGELLWLLSNPPERNASSPANDEGPRPDHATASHLEQLRAYCIDLNEQPGVEPPSVALLTNAHSHIIITDVERWIEDPGSGQAHVFASWADVVANCDQFWRLLSFHHVSFAARLSDLGHLRSLCSDLPDDWGLHYCNALRVRRRPGFQEGPGDISGSDLVVAATPCVALRGDLTSSSRPFVRLIWVDMEPYFVRVPEDVQSLQQHVTQISQHHSERRRIVSNELNPPPADGSSSPEVPIISLGEIHALLSDDVPTVQPASQSVRTAEWEEHVLLLGDEPHFVRCDTEFHDCPCHHPQDTEIHMGFFQWTSSHRDRCHFPAREVCHCGSHDTHEMKKRSTESAPVVTTGDPHGVTSGPPAHTPYGRRSNPQFCELWEIDRYLCCRVCAYWSICQRDLHNQLPCHRHASEPTHP